MDRFTSCFPSEDDLLYIIQEELADRPVVVPCDLTNKEHFAKRRVCSLDLCERWRSHFFDPRDFNEQLKRAVCRRTPSQEEKAVSKLTFLFGHIQRQFQAKLTPMPCELQPLHSAIGGAGLEVLLRCTTTPSTQCHLAHHLATVNGLLWFLHFEVTEVEPGKHAVRRVQDTDIQKTPPDDTVFGYAAMTLLFLLHTHRCIEHFEVADMFAAETGFDRMLCANIGLNNSLTRFRMSRCELSASASSRLGKALNQLLSSNLCDLSLDLVALSGESEAWLAPLLEGVAKARRLTKFGFTDIYVNLGSNITRLDAGGPLLDALESNATTTRLSVDCTLLSFGHGPQLQKFLAQTAALKELSLVCSQCSRKHEANLVFEVLPTASGITRLDVQGFVLCPNDTTLLCEFVAGSDKLEDANFVFGTRAHRRTRMANTNEQPNGTWVVEAFAEVLRKASSLRRLAVMGGFSASEIRLLLQAAHDCASLEELTFESVTFARAHFNRGKDTFPRATQMVTLRRCEPCADHMEPLVETWKEMLSETSLHPLGLLHTSSLDACLALAENCGGDHVTALSLDLQGGVTPQLAQVLAAYLASTRNLRMLSLVMSCWDRLEHRIVDGLVQNRSIEELHLDNFALNDRDTATLGRWLVGNRRLHTVSFSLEVSKYGTKAVAPNTETLLLTLATTLQKNNTLTCIHVDGYWAYLRTWHIITRKLRRNCDLLNKAAAFVLGSELRSAAIAFEIVHTHPLLSDVVQRTASLSQDQADKGIRESVQRIRHEFWRLVGIVRPEKVVGNRADSVSSAQDLTAEGLRLGQLGDELLQRIRSFLRISDVVDTRTDSRTEVMTPEEITAGVVQAMPSILSAGNHNLEIHCSTGIRSRM